MFDGLDQAAADRLDEAPDRLAGVLIVIQNENGWFRHVLDSTGIVSRHALSGSQPSDMPGVG